jgi:hypothetical protein
MSIEAMKQALEALEQVKPLYTKQHAIAALRQAIEKAEKKEPLTLRAGDGDCRDAERICADLKAKEQKGCPHATLGTSSLNHDNTPARWGCVMCGKEFIPKPATPEPVDHLLAEITKLWGVIHDQQQQIGSQREWVGLTDDEINKCCDFPLNALGMKHVRKIEAKLKERNHG